MDRFTTCFGIPVDVEDLLRLQSAEDIQQALITTNKLKGYIIVGGGSNIILNDEKKHKIAVVDVKGVSLTSEPPLEGRGDIILKVGAGENWDEVVKFAVENNLQGIEALSAIPGTAGAAPVQNIGAYGTEIKDVLWKVEVVEKTTGKVRVFTNEECKFSYRNSIFKQELKDKFIITAIYLKLQNSNTSQLPRSKEVQEIFKDRKDPEFTLQDIREAIIKIRWNKLPKPEELANVGSFFHNPIISASELEELKKILPEVTAYEIGDKFKIPAGYLIEQAGLKGYRKESVGIYEKHALVLVNHGGASFKELKSLIDFIKQTIFEKYKIELSVEPELVV
jgi:UDP-N-acetylmuramate dehydrogenase